MANEYNGDKIVLRDTEGNQMSLARFFELALNDGNGHVAIPSQGKASSFDSNHHAWDMHSSGLVDVIPVRTPTWGTVTRAGDGWNGGMGTCAIVTDEKGLEHRFMHMAEGSLQVASGDTVAQGDTLGRIGSTGDSTGAHLHYDVKRNGSKIDDPIDAYDSATLPTGWNMVDAAAKHNWNYIQLDDSAVDFGPPGGDVPSEPFFTDGYVYDLSAHQTQAEVQELCNDSTTGGFVLRFAWNSGQDDKVASHLADAQAANVPVGFYSASDKNITYDGEAAYRTMIEAQAELLATTMSIKPSDCPLGVWLDLESWGVALGSNGCGMSATPAENLRQIEIFREIFGNKGFPTCGWYSNRNELTKGMLDNTDESWKEFPYWYARPGASRSTVDSEITNFGITNCYLWQDGDGGSNWSSDKTYRHRNVDNDTVLKAIPTTGGGGGESEGDGGSYTLEILVDVIPPKRIYFNPNPGLLTIDANLQNREQSIEILTDAEDATIYYTLDGSAPYEYVTDDLGNVTYALSTSATVYSGPIKIYSDTHIRAIAISASGGLAVFDDILAKGSGTFIYSYRVVASEWAVERESYALEDSASHEALYEENKQAFILEHTKETIEDVVYATVHLSANTGGESEASEETPEIEPADNGQTPATPEPEPEDT
jgi:hypothetical protein